MSPSASPRAPTGIGPAGRRLWRSILDGYVLTEHELVLLQQATRVVDQVAELDALLTTEGLLVAGRAGEQKLHPALAEVRQQRLTLARLLTALRIPAATQGQTAASSRLQRRGLRGVYGGAS